MALSKTTRDHDEIRKWAEARGAKPAEVAGTEHGSEPGILRIEFPKSPNHNDSKLKEISWEEFFEKFDASDLELVYQDVTSEGAQSNFNKLIHPTDENHSKSHGRKAESQSTGAGAGKVTESTSHASSSSKSTASKKEANGSHAAKKTASKSSKAHSK